MASCRIKHKHKYYSLSLWDTVSDEGGDRLRPLSYPDSDIFLVCFSIDSPTSLANVRDKWLPEIQHFGSGLPFIIVGLQTDLRDDVVLLKKRAFDGTQMVTKREGEDMARRCSGKYIEGTVFEQSDLDCLLEMVKPIFSALSYLQRVVTLLICFFELRLFVQLRIRLNAVLSNVVDLDV